MDSTDAYNGGRAGDIFENRVNFEYTQLLPFSTYTSIFYIQMIAENQIFHWEVKFLFYHYPVTR